MARVAGFTDGAESGDIAFFDAVSGTVSASTAKYRSGAYSYLLGNSNGHKSMTGVGEFYLRFAIYLNSAATTFVAARVGSTQIGALSLNATTRKVEIRVGNTVMTTGNIALADATWYLIEWHLSIADSGLSEIKIDGVADASYSGDTKPDVNTIVDNIYWSHPGGSNGSMYIDDIALNDTTGGADNSWCGDGRIIAMAPNADGDSSQWDGSDGNQVNNYALVDDIPPGGTDYVESDTTDEVDLYNLAACGLSNVDILRVIPTARARDTVAAGGKIAVGIKPSGGSEQWSGDKSLLTTFGRVVGDEYTTNPATGNPWTPAELDALQVGVKVR